MSRKSTGGPSRPPGRPVDARLTPAMIEAVLDELAESGYARLTTAGVARRAGVSTATLYRRWQTKRDLILAAAEQLAEAEKDRVDTGSLHGDIRELLSRKQLSASGKPGAVLVALLGEAAHDAELAEMIRSGVIAPMREHLAAMLGRAAERGEVDEDATADAAARLLEGLVLARAAFGGSASGGGTTPADLDEDAVLILRALGYRQDRPER
ncbi:TetR/AcrR family transcriptional regulator [Amycolatopsis magusensis]|uniref:TetR/AcrR family transcriptional regulator n=1 Tax=Amycolatopsis magusensis TaxID=882444 RepID=UPI0037B5FCD5